jgi:CRISPR-associated protein Csd1
VILQALAKYYERMIQDEVPDLEPAGYKRVGIPFVLVLRKDGSLAGIDDTRKGNGRRTQARPYIVPKVFDGSRTSDVEANLLWDKASYVFGLSQEGVAKRSGKKRDKFIERLKDQQGKFLSTEALAKVIK